MSSIPFCAPDACAAAGCDPVVCRGAGVASNTALFERSAAAIPGGVNSSIRAFKAVGGTPYVVSRAEGPYIWDAEGRRYHDLVQSYGAIILGHAHPRVVEALRTAAGDGTSYGAPTPREMKLAEAIRERVPSCELVRLMNSGTEATMTAVRLARGVTGRNRIVKFAGNYHGASDALLAAAGSGATTLHLQATAGVPNGAAMDTTVVPYNVVPTLDDTVACVIVEPVSANMGLVPPRPGFLQGLRAECDRVGAVLIFDEVITGFRLGLGGAQARYEVRPDVSCFGKVIGGGLPIGAIGGARSIMEQLSPLGGIFHAGTLAGNPLATAAGLAALDELTEDHYVELAGRAARLATGLHDAFAAAGIPAQVPLLGPLVGLYFGAEAPVDYEGATTTDEACYARFFHAMLDEGVALAPGAYEVLFPGLAHTDADLDRIVECAGRTAVAAAAPRWPVPHMSMNVVAVHAVGLVKDFDTKRAVDSISLTVPAGSFYGIVGPNGAGKTTTIRMMVRLLRPDVGHVTIVGIPVWPDPPAKEVIGVLPDDLRLFERLTGAELLTYLGLMRLRSSDRRPPP
ncbi:MAG: glutamate-1-semialdehyde 2,1-aminomutase [Ilumatobacteraceae bacterium]